jgi:tetratricopeptide (TPR) repeat protein
VVDRFRKTGDTRLQISELTQADAELTVSNRVLVGRQDWSALAFGLTKQGHVYRLQAQWQQAIALYKTAEAAASRGRDVVKQSDALAWEALAESSSGNLGNALANATQAVRLAETTTDNDTRARALDVLGSVQIAQLNLTAAADTINREVAVAAQAKDPTALYYAYLNRSDVYLKLAGQCDYNRSFDACKQALDRAQADLQQAAGIVQRLGYGGLLQQTQQFMRDVTARRALVQFAAGQRRGGCQDRCLSAEDRP